MHLWKGHLIYFCSPTNLLQYVKGRLEEQLTYLLCSSFTYLQSPGVGLWSHIPIQHQQTPHPQYTDTNSYISIIKGYREAVVALARIFLLEIGIEIARIAGIANTVTIGSFHIHNTTHKDNNSYKAETRTPDHKIQHPNITWRQCE